jgi:hypothetical protein
MHTTKEKKKIIFYDPFNETGDKEYWKTKSGNERLAALEVLRQQYIKIQLIHHTPSFFINSSVVK